MSWTRMRGSHANSSSPLGQRLAGGDDAVQVALKQLRDDVQVRKVTHIWWHGDDIVDAWREAE